MRRWLSYLTCSRPDSQPLTQVKVIEKREDEKERGGKKDSDSGRGSGRGGGGEGGGWGA